MVALLSSLIVALREVECYYNQSLQSVNQLNMYSVLYISSIIYQPIFL